MANDLEKHPLTAADVEGREGLSDWRVVGGALTTSFRTGSMVRGTELLERVVEAAERHNHHPDLDLRYFWLHVRLTTHATHGLSAADAALAEDISRIAAELDAPAQPSRTTGVEIAIDALDIEAVRPFWRAVLDYREVTTPAGEVELEDRNARGPTVWFQQMEAPRRQRNRVHLDVGVPADEAEARVAAALAAGGHLVTDAHAPSWWVLADREGNEACVCTWQDDPGADRTSG